MDDLVARIEAIQRLAQHRKARLDQPQQAIQQQAQPPQAEASSKASPPVVVQLPLWPETMRGVPNGVLRSALFGVVRRGRRRYMDQELIAALDGIEIRYTGQSLDQADLDVWEQCLYIARESLGAPVRFTGHALLTAVGRHTGRSDHEWLHGALRRLMAGVVEIKDGRRAYAGQLIHDWYRDEDSRQHVININPKLVALYDRDGWTAVQWAERLALSGQMAKWLHGFYSSHAQPYPMKVETLHRLCGSEIHRLRDFRRELRGALTELQETAGWRWRIDEADLVHIERAPSASQGRHVIRRAVKAVKEKGGKEGGKGTG